jgi:hypothetical protein
MSNVFVKVFFGALTGAVIAAPVAFFYNTEVQTATCKAQLGPQIRQDMRETLTRDCVGEVKRGVYADFLRYAVPAGVIGGLVVSFATKSKGNS